MSLPNICKNRVKRIRRLWANFYQKFYILAILSLLSPHFYAYNVELARDSCVA